MLDIPQDDFLRQTGLHHVYDANKNMAVAAKVGGDNMALLERNTQMIMALRRLGVAQSYAVSAFRSSKVNFNTTGKLIAAWEAIETSGDIVSARNHFLEVAEFHTGLIDEILKHASPSIKAELLEYSQELFTSYDNSLRDARAETSKETDYIISGEGESFSLLSVWEIVAAKLMVRFLELNEIDARYIDTEIDFSWNEWLNTQVITHMKRKLEEVYLSNPECIPIIPGYIGGISGGILSTLGRGYTDYTGAQAAVALHDMPDFDTVSLYIQKLYGFKSTDPWKLKEQSKAKTIDILSYALTERAISHRWAGAGLINPFALSQEIRERAIPILVWNPTDKSAIALIDKDGCKKSKGVTLVLGRNFNGDYDARTYGMANVWGMGVDPKQIVYLMGENIENLGNIYERAQQTLKEHAIEISAWASSFGGNKELSFVFQDEDTAVRAQRVLHEHFIENSFH